jgi:hypothetical protein
MWTLGDTVDATEANEKELATLDALEEARIGGCKDARSCRMGTRRLDEMSSARSEGSLARRAVMR